MLAGDDYETLLICTSETDSPELAKKTQSGRIEIADVRS
jgi:hypothetical protein